MDRLASILLDVKGNVVGRVNVYLVLRAQVVILIFFVIVKHDIFILLFRLYNRGLLTLFLINRHELYS